jgi:tetratricopeptide (TPR) repeat protein
VIHLREKRFQRAEQAFLEARRTMTPTWDPLDSLGDLYLNHLNRLDDAVLAYRDAVADVESRGPEFFSPLPYLGLGLALARKGDAESARELLQFAARFPETRVEALRALGR